MNATIFGILAQFDSPAQLVKAAKAVREAGYVKVDAYSPYPVHGLDKALGIGDSRLGWIVLIVSLAGAAGAFWLQVWTTSIDYPFTIGGKPSFSWEIFIPVTIILMIIAATFAIFLGMLALNRLPMYYHPVFSHSQFHKATSDGFFLSVTSDDARYDAAVLKSLLEQNGGQNVEELEK